ncbi:MAG: hypothetical protein E7312_06515, partial [Clostridiales bacterium]|nr:hypothetical protein [Clostridiales bacterium]
MKKALLIVISIATLLLTSSCFYKVRPYKDLSEEDVSKLLRIHISSDMTHEEIFSKLESLGFEKFSDVHIDGLELWQDVIYYLGDVYVYVTLDITLNADVDNIIANGGINSYKSEYVTVNGVNNV